jgi:uncharacterized protein
MSEANVALVRSLYDARKRKDIQTIFELLHAEAEFYQSKQVPWGGTYKGHEEIGNFYSKLTETIDSRLDVDEFVDDAEDHVVAVGYSRGRVRDTGREFEVSAVHVWTIRDGKVVKFEAYIDTPKMRVALGL